jgi:hypothetical protein
MNNIILNNFIFSDRMTTQTELFTRKNIYEDFIKYATEHNLMKDNTYVHDDFLEYYENCIHNTDKHKAMFKHFFPKKKNYNPAKLSVHLFKQVMIYIYECNGVKIEE